MITFTWSDDDMQDSKWTAESNACITLNLVRVGNGNGDDETAESMEFEPEFTHFAFEEETIFGYSDLAIDISFGAATLKQCLDIQYNKKHNKADDIEGALFEYLSKDYSKDKDSFVKQLQQGEHSFRPLGQLIASYKIDKKGKGKRAIPDIVDNARIEDESSIVYEAYSTNWQTKGWIDWHRRMKIFNRFLIDGASDIDEDDSSWSFVTLFQRNEDGTYIFVGFVSLFSFFYFSPSLDERRQKLAQFFILPPFQGAGHGEFAVEDPSEAFEDLRDKCDLRMLADDKEFNEASLSLPKPQLEKIRRRLKIASRQFYRLLEMRTLRDLEASSSSSPTESKGKGKSRSSENDEATRAFRLAVKKRLYLFNKDTLDQVDDQERKEKLQQAYDNVVEHYRGILSSLS